MLEHLYRAFVGNRRQSSDRLVSIAQRGIKRPGELSSVEIKSLCASVLSQAGK